MITTSSLCLYFAFLLRLFDVFRSCTCWSITEDTHAFAFPLLLLHFSFSPSSLQLGLSSGLGFAMGHAGLHLA